MTCVVGARNGDMHMPNGGARRRARVGRGGRIMLDRLPNTRLTVGYCTGGGMLGHYASGGGGGDGGMQNRIGGGGGDGGMQNRIGGGGGGGGGDGGMQNRIGGGGGSGAAVAPRDHGLPRQHAAPHDGGLPSGGAGSHAAAPAASAAGAPAVRPAGPSFRGAALDLFGADRPLSLDMFWEDAGAGGAWADADACAWPALGGGADPYVGHNGVPAGGGGRAGTAGGGLRVGQRRVDEILAQPDSEDEGMLAVSYLGAAAAEEAGSDVDLDLPIPVVLQ